MASIRNHVLYMAKLAHQAELYDDMVDAMKKLANFNVELDVEERNLLSVAYKHVLDERRESWRTLALIELPKEESKFNNQINVMHVQRYCDKIRSEINAICDDVILLVDDHLLPSTSNVESSAYYYKMKGDCYRYQAEIIADDDDEKKRVADQSLKAYEEGMAKAVSLRATNPIRLGLALNSAVFYYEIMKSFERAYYMAKDAIDEAMLELGTISDASYQKNKEYYKESKIVLQLLRDNLALWTENSPRKSD